MSDDKIFYFFGGERGHGTGEKKSSPSKSLKIQEFWLVFANFYHLTPFNKNPLGPGQLSHMLLH